MKLDNDCGKHYLFETVTHSYVARLEEGGTDFFALGSATLIPGVRFPFLQKLGWDGVDDLGVHVGKTMLNKGGVVSATPWVHGLKGGKGGE